MTNSLVPAKTMQMKAVIDEDSMVYLLSLPQKRQIYNGQWKATQVSPCPLLMKCAACLRYLPATSFYETKKQMGRLDILGVRHSSRCPDCHKGVYIKLSNEQKLFYSAKQRANRKGLEFDIELSDIVIPECCPVLGLKLHPAIGIGRQGAHVKPNSPTIDRLDNSKGYVKGNIRVISYRANMVKRDSTLAEMRAIVAYMEREGHPEQSPDSPNTTTAQEVTQ